MKVARELALRIGRIYPPGTHVSEHTEAGSIKSIKNPNYAIGNRTSDFQTAPPRAVIWKPNITRESFFSYIW